VKDNQDLLAMIASRKPGETVKLDILRGGDTMKVDVKLTARPVIFDQEGRGLDSQPKDDATAPASGEGLGIRVQAIPSFMRRQLELKAETPGVVIVSVDPESDAAEEGLEPRQVITSVDDTPVNSVADWSRVVKDLEPGETVKIDLKIFGMVNGDSVARDEIVFLSVPEPKSK